MSFDMTAGQLCSIAGKNGYFLVDFLALIEPVAHAICCELSLVDIVNLSRCSSTLMGLLKARVRHVIWLFLSKVVDELSQFRDVLRRTNSYVELDVAFQACRGPYVRGWFGTSGSFPMITIFVPGRHGAERAWVIAAYFVGELGYEVCSSHPKTVRLVKCFVEICLSRIVFSPVFVPVYVCLCPVGPRGVCCGDAFCHVLAANIFACSFEG